MRTSLAAAGLWRVLRFLPTGLGPNPDLSPATVATSVQRGESVKLPPRARARLSIVTAGALLVGLVQATVGAASPPAQPNVRPAAVPANAPHIPAAARDAVLGKSWEDSEDRAWTTSGNATGLALLVADREAGYAWRTAATLSEPGFDTDLWIGNACVTGSGRRAVVAYAPRAFTNKPELMARGAFAAVVDLESGAVTKLGRQSSLAYFSPGCGTDETVVLTQAGGDDKNATRLLAFDAKTPGKQRVIELKGQVTSAVPVGKNILAADSARLVKIDGKGRRTAVADTEQIPFLLSADADGGIVYMDRPAGSATRGEVARVTAGDIARADVSKTKAAVLARGSLTAMDLDSSADGTVFITGNSRPADPLPGSVRRRPDAPTGSVASTRGEALVTVLASNGGEDPRAPQTTAARSTKVGLTVLSTGKKTLFTVTPDPAAASEKGARPSPALLRSAPTTGTGRSRTAFAAAGTVEADRSCSVARNDPGKQAMQPKPRQVEWAVDQAITGNLNKHISRPANWKNLGMGAYQPQSLFPLKALEGGGRIPAQVMLGITAQESNMWQASRVVVPGVTGNPLIGNFYGTDYSADGEQSDPWAIDWAEADCGYGITQVTDGMRMRGKEKPGETALSSLQQEAVALDYTANIASGVNILADKWNQTRKDGMTVNNGDSKYMENWFFALWAYNSGYYPKSDTAQNGGLWGVGFTNNPANPLWKANRTPFLENSSGGDDYSHAAHPQDWPYQEKVLGWAARPLQALEAPGTLVVGFRPAWWNTNAQRTALKPAEGLFCTAANSCDKSKIGPADQNEPGLGACTRADLKCWWNGSVTWKDCGAKAECGNEILRFNDTYVEEADGTAYPPNCGFSGLPSGAVVVDDVPDATPVHRPGCSTATTTGTFGFDFGTDSARVDLHQLGAGYNSHFWFAHTRKDDAEGRRLKVSASWKLNGPLTAKQARVMVHLPDHGAHTAVARYEIRSSAGVRTKTIDQRGSGNRWVSLGAYWFKGTVPEVRLTSLSTDGTGDDDIAFDAVAFVPGDYNLMPHITFPEGDANEPRFPFINEPVQAKRSLCDKPGDPGCDPLLARKAANGECSSPDSQGRSTCLRMSTVKSPIPEAPKTVRRGQAADPVVDGTKPAFVEWCPDQTGDTFTRTEACLRHYTAVEVIYMVDGKVLGQANFHVYQEIELYNNGPVFNQALTIIPTRIDAAMGNVTLDWFTSDSCDACTDSQKIWTGGGKVFSPLDLRTSRVTFQTAWNGADESEFTLAWLISAVHSSNPEAEMHKIMGNTAPDLQVRCDNILKTVVDPGCVFHKYVPTFPIATNRYPAAGAYYWLMKEKLSNHPGKKGASDASALSYILGSNEDNRSVICPEAPNFVRHPDTPDTSCDEYAFATTYESGGAEGSGIESGDECAQLYAKPLDSSLWFLLEDERFTQPKWDEICGRASIPKWQNTGALADFGKSGGFVWTNRMLDRDQFWVSTPGFDHCSVTQDECSFRRVD